MRPLDVVVVTTRAPSSVDGARESVAVAVDSLVVVGDVVVVVVDAVPPPPPGMYTAHHARASPPLTTPRTSHAHAHAIHPSIHRSIDPSIHRSIDPSISISIDRPTGGVARAGSHTSIDPCGPRREALDDAVVCTHRYTHVVGGPRQTKPARASSQGRRHNARHEGDDDDDDDGGGAGRRWRWE